MEDFGEDGESEMLLRTTISYSKASNNRFIISNKNYGHQFNHIYSMRSIQMKDVLMGLARKRWGDQIQIANKIIDSEANALGAECALVGVLYKEMSMRSSVLDEFKEHNGISGTTQPVHNFSSQVWFDQNNIYIYFIHTLLSS